jgi:GTPase SAR1 family protein
MMCVYHWIPEVRRHCPSTPIVLVGTKTNDYWNSNNVRNSTFSVEDGMLLAQQNNADTYVECSLNMEDIDAVFVAAVRAAVKAKSRQPARLQQALNQRPQSVFNKFKLAFAGRRLNVR